MLYLYFIIYLLYSFSYGKLIRNQFNFVSVITTQTRAGWFLKWKAVHRHHLEFLARAKVQILSKLPL